MDIIKKDGRIEAFNHHKIKTSIANAALDANMPLNESDLHILVQDVINTVEKTRENNGNTSSFELVGIIFNILRKDKFYKILKSFIEFEKDI